MVYNLNMDAVIGSVTGWVAKIFGNHVWLATIIISIIPLLEVKASIPFAMDRGYTFWQALSFGMIGSAIVAVALTFLFALVLKLLKKTKTFKKVALRIEKRVAEKSSKINKDVESKTADEINIKKQATKKFWLKYLSVIAFVAVPIPLTGVWMGTCIAVFIGLKNYQSISAVLIGNFIASTLVSLLSKLIGQKMLLLIMFAIVVLIILYFIIKCIIRAVKNKNKKTEEQDNEKTESR